jgi:hypothetical protein
MAFLSASGVGWFTFVARSWCALLAACALLAGSAVAGEPGPPSGEYQIKAVFLFNFAQFVEWPPRAFADSKAPIVLGVLGQDPFGRYLDELVKGETVGERPIVVRRYASVSESDGCHLLFVCRSEAPRLEKIVASLRGKSILTLSDADAFTRVGGMVRFVMEEGKVRLRINVEAARLCGLTISSKILRPATIVTTGRD